MGSGCLSWDSITPTCEEDDITDKSPARAGAKATVHSEKVSSLERKSDFHHV